MTIRILSESIINRIAAGEVIERPASAVKELVENSIDAGAKNIEVYIEEGGKSLIRVKDDGFGMDKDELKLAVKRHATSKLTNDDLFDINSFGFRGEALPSIASVSRISISSLKVGKNEGWRLDIEGGEEKEIQPSAISSGTVIEIRDLFYATPARLKFLKTERAEKSRISEMLKRIAMANPNVSFKLEDEKKKVFEYKIHNNELLEAGISRLEEILGKEFAENSVAVEGQRNQASLRGYASLPTYNKATSADQYLFVNNRPVRDKLLLGAIKGAYQDFLARDRHPVVALFIDLPPNEVDVNVHPAKAEIRFRYEGEIRGMIVGVIKNALAGAGHRASTTISNAALSNFQVEGEEVNKAKFQGNYRYSSGGRPQPQSDFNGNFNRSYDYEYSKPLNEAEGDFLKSNFRQNLNTNDRIKSNENMESNVGRNDIFDENQVVPFARHQQNYDTQQNKKFSSYPLGAATAQLHETYIIAQAEDGIVIVDQHAAHERLVYENLKKQYFAEKVRSQSMLIPEIIELGEDETERLIKYKQSLSNFGLEVEKFGINSIEVKAVPELLAIKKESISNLVKNIADEIEEYGEEMSLKERFEHILETMACHGSIRSGRRMNIDEMNEMLRQMENTPYSGQCNHGRPTYIKLALHDVEKMFGRK